MEDIRTVTGLLAREGLGATACLGKPVTAADLRALMGGVLQLHQRSS